MKCPSATFLQGDRKMRGKSSFSVDRENQVEFHDALSRVIHMYCALLERESRENESVFPDRKTKQF